MRNKASIELYTYWNALRGGRAVPQRQEIEPGDIRRILPDLFILEHTELEHSGSEQAGQDDIRIRLAGTNICNLFGRELRGTGFEDVWIEASRQALTAAIVRALHLATPVIMSLTGHTATGETTSLEIALFPLSSGGPVADRMIGAMTLIDHSPLAMPMPLDWLTLKGTRVLDTSKADVHFESGLDIPAPATISAVRHGFGDTIRRVLHLRVFDGGRAG